MSGQPEPQPQPAAEQQHKLETAWVLWYDSSTAAPVSRSNAVSGWISNLKRIARFTTIEEFWGVMNSVPPASAVSHGSNYFIFKEVHSVPLAFSLTPSLLLIRAPLTGHSTRVGGRCKRTGWPLALQCTAPPLISILHFRVKQSRCCRCPALQLPAPWTISVRAARLVTQP